MLCDCQDDSANKSYANLHDYFHDTKNCPPTTTQPENVDKRKLPIVNYQISPKNSDESDADLKNADNINTEDVNIESENTEDINIQSNKGKKRARNSEIWKKNYAKKMRNSGQVYQSMTKKMVTAREVKSPCKSECKYKCCENINSEQRQALFHAYWKLGDILHQRSFINSCMVDITPRYKYTNASKPRKNNKAFYFITDEKRIRVCKLFFMKTLDISDRVIRTVKDKTDENGFIQEDLRGKHESHKKIDNDLLADIKEHINSIPRTESHYTRATSTREYIDGGKTRMDLYKDFKILQQQNNKPFGTYHNYYQVFTTHFNLTFFQPKKDQCDLCLQFTNSTVENQKEIQEKYKTHLEEKELARQEKHNDRCQLDKKNKVIVFDLQAVLQSPRGDISAFYYKSKFNSYNFTVTELNKKESKKKFGSYNDVHCFFWKETDAKRGAIEIGSCLLQYMETISKAYTNDDLNIIFYSDNCCGQNKNKYIATLYLYAVTHLNIQSITHKFLIKGHTQNEADNVHSLIKKEIKKNLKSGPIYSPHQYTTLIKSAKKSGNQFHVHELTFDFFIDLKKLQIQWGYNFNEDKKGKAVTWNDIKVLKFAKQTPFSFFYKTSYKEEQFSEVSVRNKRKKMPALKEILPEKAYNNVQELSANKKKDLTELITKNLIPNFYADFYNSVL